MTLEQLLAPLGLSEAEVVEAVAERLGDTASAGLPAEQQALLEQGGLGFDEAHRYATDAVADLLAGEVGLLHTAVPLAEVATRMGLSVSWVRHLIAAGRLLAMRSGRRTLLPAWQFGEDGRPLHGLDVALRAARPGQHPLAWQAFMATPQPDLELGGQPMTPRQWLASGGDPAAVADLLAGDLW